MQSRTMWNLRSLWIVSLCDNQQEIMSKREVNLKTGEYNQVATVFISKSSLSHIYN
ncbi:unnamed protein product [Mycena citricolor]|uniref:Uncharacterized protein n=1 Tax=Mycena citricolor TaxID=2018698 RepID=A0AAD2Q2U6_9AGAR|nr:unnamed protein product [Mycena citricolor]